MEINKNLVYLPFLALFSILILIFPLGLNLYVKIGLITLIFLIYFAKYLKDYIEEEEMVYNFPLFLRDLSNYLKIGQTLPVSVENLLSNNYGTRLNKEIKYLVTQMRYGRTFNEALEEMANRIKKREISEVILNINNVMKSGGDLASLLETLSDSFGNINMIKKERLSQLKLVAYTYYGLYFGVVFSIFIIYLLIINIKMTSFGYTQEQSQSIISLYKWMAFILLLVNAVFTGLVIGKVANGKIVSGIIHSIILTIIAIGFFLLL
ncbi:MAG: type II secretion system F family protein [Nanopusillaceae archaeon]